MLLFTIFKIIDSYCYWDQRDVDWWSCETSSFNLKLLFLNVILALNHLLCHSYLASCSQVFGAIEEPASIGFPVGQSQNVDVSKLFFLSVSPLLIFECASFLNDVLTIECCHCCVCSWRAPWCHTSACCLSSERASAKLPESRKVGVRRYSHPQSLSSGSNEVINCPQWQSCCSCVTSSAMTHYRSSASDWKIMKVTEKN